MVQYIVNGNKMSVYVPVRHSRYGLVTPAVMGYNDVMLERLPLAFNVQCTACYGAEVWKLGRITRLLTAAGKLPPGFESNIEFIAEQFMAHCKQIVCPSCEKKGVLTAQRIVL